MRPTAEGTPLDQDPVPEEIWNRPISSVLKSLGATAAGLSRAEADARRRRYGPNQPQAHRRRPLWLRFLARFLNPLVLMLLFASALGTAARLGVRGRNGYFPVRFPVRQKQRGLDREAGERRS